MANARTPMTRDEVLAALREVADPTRLPGMARVGIDTEGALGVSVPDIRRIAKRAGRDQALAQELWATGIHEARLVAALVADPDAFTMAEMARWAGDLDSWDITDMLADTFASSRQARRAIRLWSKAPHGFTKRCAFAMIARLAVTRDDGSDASFGALFPLIRAAATDERNEVKKAVNWALRQIGKRNLALHEAAIDEAEVLLALDDRTARWIARDALRELRDPATVARIRS
jgi:3-methyladenine DNA glycosylase AlkD